MRTKINQILEKLFDIKKIITYLHFDFCDQNQIEEFDQND